MKLIVFTRPPISSFARRAVFSGAALLLGLSLRPALVAQPIVTFGSPTAVTGPSDILTTGTFHAAIGATAANVTVGGVTFATSSPLITLTNASAINYTPGTFSSGNAAYDALINRGYYTPIAMSAQIDLSGLTVGHQYRIQFWTPAWDANFPTTFIHDGGLNFGNTATAPTYAVGTFTANNSTEYFNFASTDGSTRGLMSAITVYNVSAIPEPSTYAVLAGLGVLGVALWRRKARRAT